MNRKSSPKISTTVLDSGRVVVRSGFATLAGYLFLRIDLLAIATALLLGTHLASLVISRSALKGLRLQITASKTRARCNQPTSATLTIKNRNRIFPLFYPTFSIRQKDTLRIQVYQFHGIIAPRSEAQLTVDPSFETRGLHRLEVFAARSLFPFALHQTTSSQAADSNPVIVWPAPAPIDLDSLLHEPPRPLHETAGERALLSNANEATRIRDYSPGDPKPRINWKLSAKRDQLTVIEPRDHTIQRYELHLDTSNQLWPSELVFERMLRLVSTLVSELSRRKLAQGIIIDQVHYPLTNTQQILHFHDVLAQLQPSDRSEPHLVDHFPTSSPNRKKRLKQLWILPAPHSSITLSSLSHEIENALNS